MANIRDLRELPAGVAPTDLLVVSREDTTQAYKTTVDKVVTAAPQDQKGFSFTGCNTTTASSGGTWVDLVLTEQEVFNADTQLDQPSGVFTGDSFQIYWFNLSVTFEPFDYGANNALVVFEFYNAWDTHYSQRAAYGGYDAGNVSENPRELTLNLSLAVLVLDGAVLYPRFKNEGALPLAVKANDVNYCFYNGMKFTSL